MKNISRPVTNYNYAFELKQHKTTRKLGPLYGQM